MDNEAEGPEKKTLENYLNPDLGEEDNNSKMIASSIKSGDLEGIVEELVPEKKSFLGIIKSALSLPIRNYNVILGAMLPISYFAAVLSMDVRLSIPEIILFPAMGYLFSYMSRNESRVKPKKIEKESFAKRSIKCIAKNYLIAGFAIGTLWAGNSFFLNKELIQEYSNAIGSSISVTEFASKNPGNEEISNLAEKTSNELKELNNKLISQAFLNLVSGGLLMSSVVKVASWFHPEETEFWKNEIPYVYNDIVRYHSDWNKRRESGLYYQRRIFEAGYKDKKTLLALSYYEIATGDLKNGIYHLSKILEHRESGSALSEIEKTPLNKIAVKLAKIMDSLSEKYLFDKHDSEFEDSLERAFQAYYTNNNINESISYWEKTISLAPKEHKHEFELLYSMFLENSGQKEKSRDKISGWLSGIVKSDSFINNVREIPSSRNEVFELVGSEFLRDTIVIKRNRGIEPESEEKRIFMEYFTNLFLSDIFRNKVRHNFPSIAPTSLFIFKNEEDGRLYHIMKRTEGRNLDEFFREASVKEKEECLKKVMESSALMHSSVIDFIKKDKSGFYFAVKDFGKDYRVGIDEFDYISVLKARLVKRLGENSMLGSFLKEASEYAQSFEKLPRVFLHGDAYLTNFIEDGSWIDLEKRTIANPMVDIAGILESPGCTGVDKEMLLRLYAREFSANYRGRKGAGFEDNLVELYLPNKIFNCLYQIGSKSAQKRADQAAFFLTEVLSELQKHNLETLYQSLTGYIGNTGNEEFIRLIKKV
ncbi:MAG: hypothetical protein NTV63_01395 [Candidatus Woesearchaeota archaeon]|nr:hypothetical protein [Candidatus Woesearchaeota archaeon]